MALVQMERGLVEQHRHDVIGDIHGQTQLQHEGNNNVSLCLTRAFGIQRIEDTICMCLSLRGYYESLYGACGWR